ncbi:unnamed protein product [Urochloa humidicola]
MLLRMVAAADDGAGSDTGVGRPRLFAVPRLLVGLRTGKYAGTPADCDSPTAGTQPDVADGPQALLRSRRLALRWPCSPRSWDSTASSTTRSLSSAPAPGTGF